MANADVNVEEEIARMTQQHLQEARKETEPLPPLPRSVVRGNGPEATERQGVADDLAKFVEQHADDMMREAQQHLDEARAFAAEVRQHTADQIAKLKAYTDSIKASRDGMAQVRMAFVNAATGPQAKVEK